MSLMEKAGRRSLMVYGYGIMVVLLVYKYIKDPHINKNLAVFSSLLLWKAFMSAPGSPTFRSSASWATSSASLLDPDLSHGSGPLSSSSNLLELPEPVSFPPSFRGFNKLVRYGLRHLLGVYLHRWKVFPDCWGETWTLRLHLFCSRFPLCVLVLLEDHSRNGFKISTTDRIFAVWKARIKKRKERASKKSKTTSQNWTALKSPTKKWNLPTTARNN